MNKHLPRFITFAFVLCAAAPLTCLGDEIPKTAWPRPLGQPLDHPGVRKNNVDIDDGYWQGAGRWLWRWNFLAHLAWRFRSLAHQDSGSQVRNGACQSIRNVSESRRRQRRNRTGPLNGHPADARLSSWQWDYPVGAGEYAALYPKSWYDYEWEKFPAHVVLEQFSPVLPDNYKESSYPIAVYRWHAENPTNRPVTVSVLLSWTNMAGWFRTFTRDFKGAPSQGNKPDAPAQTGYLTFNPSDSLTVLMKLH